jgi:DNA mismatch repair protein MutL
MTLAITHRQLRRLPPELINRIAAGEVVERPASLLKELVENSLDAGATEIAVDVSPDTSYLRVADNGCGMAPDDLPLAFENHATSKVPSADTLNAIGTLGFRGEALASISAVASVRCQSRQAHAPQGVELRVVQGQVYPLQPTACAVGTIMEVSDLFANVPARLKFLKRPQAELAAMTETMQHLALSHPKVRFTYTCQGKKKLATTANPSPLQRVIETFNLNPADAQHLVEGQWTDPLLGATAHVVMASPKALHLHQGTRKAWWQVLNQRGVRCQTLGKAIELGLKGVVAERTYPLAVVWLTWPPEQVDVNVHPAKREVRYQRPNEVLALVRHTVQQTLATSFSVAYGMQTPPPKAMDTDTAALTEMALRPFGQDAGLPSVHRPSGLLNQRAMGWQRPLPLTSPVGAMPQALDTTPLPPTPEAASQTDEPTYQQSQWRVIGQLKETYILLETQKGLMVVDQHIASERYGYERLMRQRQGDVAISQPLLTPEPLPLSEPLADVLAQVQPKLEALGFGFGHSPTQGWQLTALPLVYPDRAKQLSWREQLQHLLTHVQASGQVEWEEQDLLATLACHSAVRAGDRLSPAQMEAIVAQWLACTLPWSCPHGRPIAHLISADELNTFFDRPSLPTQR